MDLDKMVKTAMTSFLAIAAIGSCLTSNQAIAAEKMEKYYGIVKAGMNDCQTNAFIFLPTGVCDKPVDRGLKP